MLADHRRELRWRDIVARTPVVNIGGHTKIFFYKLLSP